MNIDSMRDICGRTKQLLDYITPFVISGVTTNYINDLCETYTIQVLEAESAPLNYKGFPKSICTSKNNVICHGIPDDIILKDGDIINIDVTLKKKYDGVYHYGDSSRMIMIGRVHPRHRFLCETAYKCLLDGISVVKNGIAFNKIGEVIERTANSSGFSIVKDFVGHGIGTEFHTEPQIKHYKNNDGGIMTTGMIFTIEPMVNEKSYKSKILQDGWTTITRDGGWSAQWEHTLVVTDSGCEVLTL